jgi:serine/threonine protein kinase
VSADIWSVGILAFELAFLEPPHYSMSHENASLVIMLEEPPRFPSAVNNITWEPSLVDFVTCCLQKNPANRKTAEQLLSHPFLKLAYSHEEWIRSLKERIPRWPFVPM